MGRRLNISQPVVISTELSALTTMFEIVRSDTLEQWYYANTNQFKPDRSLYALTLTPRMKAYDPDVQTTYTPAFHLVRWFAAEGNDKEFEIINTKDSDTENYIKDDKGTFALTVKKNVPSDAPVVIRCLATYIDPREKSTYGLVEETVTLRTNRDATEVFPIVTINTPKQMTWNPFGDWENDNYARFVLQAKVTYQGNDVTAANQIVWYGTETEGGITSFERPIEELPAYVSGQGTAVLTVDARFAEHLTVIAKARPDATSSFYASEDYRTIAWKVPHMDAMTYSEQGAAVRESTESMTFGSIINVPGDRLSEEVMRENLAFAWKRRLPSERNETAIGWGLKAAQTGKSLIQPNGGTVLVYPHVHLLGALKVVTLNGDTIVDGDGHAIVERGNEGNNN